MAITLQEAVADLYRIAVVEGKKQSPLRLATLARLVGEQLERRGLKGTKSEVRLRAWAREKDWDAVLVEAKRVRVAVSCKSILRNLPGTVPNRGDDLMGEAADLQLRYPEVIVGYVTIIDEGQDVPPGPNGAYIPKFEERLRSVAIRRPPTWQGGLIEAGAVVRVDFRQGTRPAFAAEHSRCLLRSPGGRACPAVQRLLCASRQQDAGGPRRC